MVVALNEQSHVVTADIRRLVQDLRPLALDDLGLMLAVRNRMSRNGARSITMTSEAPNLPTLPAASWRLSKRLGGAVSRPCCKGRAEPLVGRRVSNWQRHAWRPGLAQGLCSS
jgi:hypothetical protein